MLPEATWSIRLRTPAGHAGALAGGPTAAVDVVLTRRGPRRAQGGKRHEEQSEDGRERPGASTEGHRCSFPRRGRLRTQPPPDSSRAPPVRPPRRIPLLSPPPAPA